MEHMCSICLDRLFSVNTDVSVTQCGHLFHKTCQESSLEINRNCPICKTRIINIVEKVYPDVFDELVYNSTSKETVVFFDKICDLEKEKRISMVRIIKTLDKENINLKQLNKSYEENIKICKVFLGGFQADKLKWQEKSQHL